MIAGSSFFGLHQILLLLATQLECLEKFPSGVCQGKLDIHINVSKSPRHNKKEFLFARFNYALAFGCDWFQLYKHYVDWHHNILLLLSIQNDSKKIFRLASVKSKFQVMHDRTIILETKQ